MSPDLKLLPAFVLFAFTAVAAGPDPLVRIEPPSPAAEAPWTQVRGEQLSFVERLHEWGIAVDIEHKDELPIENSPNLFTFTMAWESATKFKIAVGLKRPENPRHERASYPAKVVIPGETWSDTIELELSGWKVPVTRRMTMEGPPGADGQGTMSGVLSMEFRKEGIVFDPPDAAIRLTLLADVAIGMYRKLYAEGAIRFTARACRAGATVPSAGDLAALAWYHPGSEGTTHPVGTKEANAWGLFDMQGNVWCRDWYGEYPGGTIADPSGAVTGTERVRRGGSARNDAATCGSANRSCIWFGNHERDVGFRLAFVYRPAGGGDPER